MNNYNSTYTLLEKTQLNFKTDGEDFSCWDLLDKTFIIPDDFIYSVYIVEQDYIARPDLVALALYGNDQAADFICKLNGISNPFDLNEGMVLIIPALTELNKFIYNGSDKGSELSVPGTNSEKVSISSSILKLQKSITDKTRQPNTAIINQPNFTIDKKKRTIIY